MEQRRNDPNRVRDEHTTIPADQQGHVSQHNPMLVDQFSQRTTVEPTEPIVGHAPAFVADLMDEHVTKPAHSFTGHIVHVVLLHKGPGLVAAVFTDALEAKAYVGEKPGCAYTIISHSVNGAVGQMTEQG